MKNITFIDTEVSPKTNKIFDYAAERINDEYIHTDSSSEFILSIVIKNIMKSFYKT